jgi:hypothetical protein
MKTGYFICAVVTVIMKRVTQYEALVFVCMSSDVLCVFSTSEYQSKPRLQEITLQCRIVNLSRSKTRRLNWLCEVSGFNIRDYEDCLVVCEII